MKRAARKRSGCGVRSATALAAALAAAGAPATALANDMSGLVFVVLIWPAAALLALVLFVFLVICIVHLSRGVTGRKARRTGTVSLAVAGGSWLLFAVWTLAWVGLEAERHLGMGLAHVAAFGVFCLPTALLGRALRRRAAAS